MEGSSHAPQLPRRAGGAAAAATDAPAQRPGRRRRPRWDGRVALSPAEPSFEDALAAWAGDAAAGVYAPRWLGTLCGGGSGRPMALTPSLFADPPGGDALTALEALVAARLVARPHLTLMRLRRGADALSRLDSAAGQLAAAGVLIRGGCWLAAMQVACADGLRLPGVLAEMRELVELTQRWPDQVRASASRGARWRACAPRLRS